MHIAGSKVTRGVCGLVFFQFVVGFQRVGVCADPACKTRVAQAHVCSVLSVVLQFRELGRNLVMGKRVER